MSDMIEQLKASGAPADPRALSSWRAKHSDEGSCFLVLRVIHCKIHWLDPDDKWQRSQKRARWWSDREEAYQQARTVGGLLYLYDEGGGL